MSTFSTLDPEDIIAASRVDDVPDRWHPGKPESVRKLSWKMNGSLRHTLDSEPRPPRSARPHPVPATNADSSASNARPTYDGDPLPPQPSSSASESPFTVVDEPASSRVHVRPFTPADPDNSDDDGTNTADSASSPTNEATQRQESVSAKDEDTTEANSEEVNTFSTSTVFIRYEDLREALRLVPPLGNVLYWTCDYFEREASGDKVIQLSVLSSCIEKGSGDLLLPLGVLEHIHVGDGNQLEQLFPLSFDEDEKDPQDETTVRKVLVTLRSGKYRVDRMSQRHTKISHLTQMYPKRMITGALVREQNEVVGENEGADTGSDIGSENLPTPPESNRNPPKPIDGLSISINHSGLENCVVEDLSGGSSMYDKEYLLKWINPSQMPNGIEMDILPGLTPDQQGGYYVISLDDLYLQHMEIFDYKINIQSMRNVLIKIPADSEGILGVNTKKVVNDVWDIYPESIKPADLRAPEEEDDLDDETTSRFLDALGFGTRTPETIGYDYLTFSGASLASVRELDFFHTKLGAADEDDAKKPVPVYLSEWIDQAAAETLSLGIRAPQGTLPRGGFYEISLRDLWIQIPGIFHDPQKQPDNVILKIPEGEMNRLVDDKKAPQAQVVAGGNFRSDNEGFQNHYVAGKAFVLTGEAIGQMKVTHVPPFHAELGVEDVLQGIHVGKIPEKLEAILPHFCVRGDEVDIPYEVFMKLAEQHGFRSRSLLRYGQTGTILTFSIEQPEKQPLADLVYYSSEDFPNERPGEGVVMREAKAVPTESKEKLSMSEEKFAALTRDHAGRVIQYSGGNWPFGGEDKRAEVINRTKRDDGMQMIDLNEARPILYDETLHSKASSINTNDTIVLHNDATQGTVHILIDFEKKFREVHDREFDTSTDSLQSRRPSSFELELVFDYDTIEKLFNTDPESLIEWVQASLRSSSVFLLRLLHTLEPTFMSNMHRAQRDPVEMTLLRHGEKESDQTVTVDIMPQIPFAETLEERLDEKITQLNASSSSSSSSSTVSETVNAPSGAPQIPLSLQLEAIRNGDLGKPFQVLLGAMETNPSAARMVWLLFLLQQDISVNKVNLDVISRLTEIGRSLRALIRTTNSGTDILLMSDWAEALNQTLKSTRYNIVLHVPEFGQKLEKGWMTRFGAKDGDKITDVLNWGVGTTDDPSSCLSNARITVARSVPSPSAQEVLNLSCGAIEAGAEEELALAVTDALLPSFLKTTSEGGHKWLRGLCSSASSSAPTGSFVGELCLAHAGMRAYTENDKKRLALQLQDLADAYKGFYKTDSEANYHNFLTSIMKKINGELDAQNVPLKLKLPFSLAGSVETWMDRTEGKRNGARVGGVRNWGVYEKEGKMLLKAHVVGID